jgi:uncharacterized repeat protein (TIGR02543 family)
MANRDRAHQKARAMGVPIRHVQANGTVTEIMGLDEDGEFLIYTTHNANAAISSAANLVYPAPYNLDGTGITVGVWDESAVRSTHTEFLNSRATVRDGATTLSSHATHVAGTVGARGASATRKGMAPNAFVDSYDWISDNSEMTSAGASSPQQAGRITISNHSYGFATGWRWNGSNWQWSGTGTNQNAYAVQFGQYTSQARDWDSIAFNAPYYLIFKAAGNDNSDNPSAGNQVVIGGSIVTYDPAIHPAGDGLYRNTTTNAANGYENISHGGNGKNIMTIGAVNDAVSSGSRNIANGTLASFSSRGPTDDGRIKPDIVANGVTVSSTESTGDTAYSSKSGTSMASPSAAGSAALLVQLYRNLFPGGDMRASTLKGLIIHTATDVGNPGPDYHFGWGLMDTKTAADLIIDHHANPSKNRMIEDQITTSITSRTYSFTWDGSSPIRATLCWTDPAGLATTTHDLRSARLINDLDLKLIAPNGTQHYPFVMPFVGTWTVASMSAHATTGVNSTDNVEQALVQNPNQTGVWQAVVNYKGSLTNNQQRYSLLLSGVSDGVVPLVLESITPKSGTVGTTVTADITGTALSTDTTIRLRRAGRPDILGSSVQMINATTLRCQFDLTGAASGDWDLVATNPDAETFTLADAFSISGSLTTIWSENFDGATAPAGWTSTAQQGNNSWSIVTTASHSPSKSYFASGPISKTRTDLTSPTVFLPSDATNLALEFWHQYDFQNQRDCGKLFLSIDGGAWFDITSSSSGAAFTLNGYNATIGGTGNPNGRNVFENQTAWTGKSNTFIRTSVALNDISKFAGKNLRMRWAIATDSSTASTGWWVDSIAILSDSSAPNQAPVITVAANSNATEFQTEGTATWHIIRGVDTNLSVTASDDAGEELLNYQWQAEGPAPVTFSLNEDNAAKATTAVFSAIGDYIITATVVDAGGLSASSTVHVRVLETPEFVVTPAFALLSVGNTQQFTANVIDQFNTPLAVQPSPITWATDGGGGISSTGLFNATTAGGPYTLTASGGGESGTAEISINAILAGIELQNLDRLYNGGPQVVTATTTPAGLPYHVTYNGSDTAPVTGGAYQVVANIADPNYEGNTTGVLFVAVALGYDGNGNTSGTPPGSQIQSHEEDLIIAGPGSLLRTGYTFAGWNTAADGSGIAYSPGATYNENINATLYAQWTANTYTVTFDPNGGDAAEPASKEITFDAAYGSLAMVSRIGYAFDGWFTATSGGAEVSAETTVTTADHHTLYAQWSLIPVSVVTDITAVDVPEDGSAAFQARLSAQPAATVTVTITLVSGDTDIDVQSGDTLTFTTSNWDAWQTITLFAANDADTENGTSVIRLTPDEPAYTGTEIIATEVDKDTILTIASGGNGDTDPSGEQIVQKGSSTSISANPNEGYEFVNWTVTSGSATIDDDAASSTMVTANAPATVQANFTIKQYTLNYSAGADGSLSGPSSQTVTHGDDGAEVTAIPDPGYRFTTWNDAVTTASRIDTNITSDLNVTASFSPETLMVTFNPNGGDSPSFSEKPVTFDSEYGDLPTISRAGYAFLGWFTSESGGIPITAGSLVETAENHTLFAQWDALPVDQFLIAGIPPRVEPGTTIDGISITAMTASAGIATHFDGVVTFSGTAGITGTSQAFVDGLLQNVSITPGVVGPNLTFIVTDADGKTGTAVFSVEEAADDFEAWAGNHEQGGNGGNGTTITFQGDANGDGIADGLAWLLGAGSPSEPATHMLPVPIVDEQGSLKVRFHYLPPSRRGNASLSLQYSTSLVGESWMNVMIPDEQGTHQVDDVSFVITMVNGDDLMEVQAAVAHHVGAESGKVFVRLMGLQD